MSKKPPPKLDSPFFQRLQQALAVYAVRPEAPDIARFITRRAKELKIRNPASSRQTVHNWMKGKTPDPDGYALMSRILNVSCYWLISGEGDMAVPVKLDADSREALDIFNQLSRAGENVRDSWIRSGRELVSITTPKGPGNPFKVTS